MGVSMSVEKEVQFIRTANGSNFLCRKRRRDGHDTWSGKCSCTSSEQQQSTTAHAAARPVFFRRRHRHRRAVASIALIAIAAAAPPASALPLGSDALDRGGSSATIGTTATTSSRRLLGKDISDLSYTLSSSLQSNGTAATFDDEYDWLVEGLGNLRQLQSARRNNQRLGFFRPWRLFLLPFRRGKSAGQILDETLTRLASDETVGAVRTVRRILSRFADHGVVDVFALHNTRDVLLSGLALGRVQEAASLAVERGCTSTPRKRKGGLWRLGGGGSSGKKRVGRDAPALIKEPDLDLLDTLARYAIFAMSTYGWKGRLALNGRLHLGNVRALVSRTGIDRSDVVDCNWRSRTHRPAYFIVRDVERKKLLLCVRGTWSPRDVLTDLCCTAEDFSTHEQQRGVLAEDDLASLAGGGAKERSHQARAHHGMLEAARGVAKMTRNTIANELEWDPDYDLVIIGHSLGGGVAAVLGSMWHDTFPGLAVLAYGSPCVGPPDVVPTVNDAIISVVAEGDPFSCLSLGHLADISAALSRLCEDDDLRDDILRRTKGDVKGLSKADLRWCHDTMEQLREECMTAEKFYPPGRILHLEGAVLGFGGGFRDNGISLKEVTSDKFRELRFHPRMLDLSRHIPNRYEAVLQKLYISKKG